MRPDDVIRQVGVVDSHWKQYLAFDFVGNPHTGDIICDTGQLDEGYYDVVFYMGGSAALNNGQFRLAWRDAPNTGQIWFMPVYEGTVRLLQLSFTNLQVQEDERFRIQTDSDFAGNVYGAVLAIKRA